VLPFDVPGNERWVEIAPGLRLPQYGCLTVSEAIALEHLLTDELRAMLQSPDLTTSIYFRSLLAAVVLISRHDSTLTLQAVMALEVKTLAAVSNFLLSEKDAGTPKADPNEAGQKTDWAELWWKLQRHYPHEPRFRAEQFGNCPIVFVTQAQASLRDEEIERLSAEAVALARHGYYLLASQGHKNVEPDWFNPWQTVLERSQAKAEIDESAARLFLELCSEKLVPPWVVATAGIEKIRRAAGD
jgi:hypothetical protein